MNMRTTYFAATLTALAALPGIANASFVLDTGTPGGSASALSGSQWVAAEFSLSSTEDITSIATYLTAGNTGQANDGYTYYIYSPNVIGARAANRPADIVDGPIAGSYTSDGWNTTSTNFTLGPGNYWLAVQTSTAQTKGLFLPSEASATTGTVPATAFAWYSTTGTGSVFSTTGAPTFGVQIGGTPVPLPGAAWLFGGGLAGLLMRARRRT